MLFLAVKTDVWYCRHHNSCRSGVRQVRSVVSAVDKVPVVVVVVKDVV